MNNLTNNGANRFSSAQGAIKNAASTLKLMQIGLTVVGGFLILGGVGTAIFSSVVNGGISIAIGISIISTAWRVLPQFMTEIREAGASVGQLAAQEQLAQTGVPASARVLTVNPTGTMVNQDYQVAAGLEVHGPNGAYTVQTLALISPVYLPRFQPGSTVNVRVDPRNPYEVAVVQ